ncbi:GntR family transcriptional regulator [Lacrimispora saccharolytica]|uniref:Transcriptional regulator, GntR family n=1 Tax=Lacrimispora saccharolytica (strain ATCC 35040 / DSM 2544 / NRCC 2533 / WM1) TaxID=610130 RepID=D9R3Q5_LACSW|nr:GntR family transcriptional regulator [Lacrimispora saccharolytica]ADL06776.1 transcriptional regulator, GntR family [[Clostridium] saccharolyticum WM1]QRV19157.1 GntR family transcriptional regulator [Lacrimispora saccharolytica]
MPKMYNLLSLDIAEYLEQYIEQHQLQPGDKLPSERELSASLNVTRVTLRHGLEILTSQGMVLRVHGSGYYICPPKVNRELIHYCFPYKDTVLQQRNYYLGPVDYMPTPILIIAKNIFAPICLNDMITGQFSEIVDETPISLMYTFQSSDSKNLLPEFPNTRDIPENIYFSQTIRIYDDADLPDEHIKELLQITSDDNLLLISTFIYHENKIVALCLSICVGTRVNLISEVKLP